MMFFSQYIFRLEKFVEIISIKVKKKEKKTDTQYISTMQILISKGLVQY